MLQIKTVQLSIQMSTNATQRYYLTGKKRIKMKTIHCR